MDMPRCQLCAGSHTTRNYKSGVIHYKAREGRGSAHTNVTCANCRRSYYAMLLICSSRKQTVSIARSRKDEWRMLEQERQPRREEKEAAEKAKETRESMEVAATA